MENILITICGRAGSKGLKNKNLSNLLDKPLVYYTLAAAFDFKSRLTNTTVDICLNTDSQELVNLVKEKYNEVYVINRKEELSEDTTPKLMVFQDSLLHMEKLKSIKYQYLIDLDITSPLRKIDDVYNAYKLKNELKDTQLIFSVCESRRNPYFNMVKSCGSYVEKIINSDFTARQQAPEVYDMNASIYVFEANFIRENKTSFLWDAVCSVYIMEDTAVLDIDNERDFRLIQVVAKYLFESNKEYNDMYMKIRN